MKPPKYLSNDKTTVKPMSEVMAIKASGATIGSRYSPKSEIASILIDGNPRVTSIQKHTRKSKTPRPKIQHFFCNWEQIHYCIFT
jgi:hypothetical protein